MTKWIGRPILACLIVAAGILTTTAVASAAGSAPSYVYVTASPANPVVGQSVTYNIYVSDYQAAPPVAGNTPGAAPSGSVTISDAGNSSPGCTSAALTQASPAISSGLATGSCTTTYTKAETGQTVTVTYPGDGFYAASADTYTLTVGKQATSTTVKASPTSNPVTGQTLTFMATVSPTTPLASTVPTGSVTFSDTVVGAPAGCTSSVNLSATGTATCTVVVGLTSAPLPSIDATYSGDSNFVTSSYTGDAATTGSVQPAGTQVTITPSILPAAPGEPVTFTANVTSTQPGSGTPAGTLTWSFPGAGTCEGSLTPTLVNGSATCTVAGTYFSIPGLTIDAQYGGEVTTPTYNSSSATYDEAVALIPTSVTLIVNPKHVHAGGPMNLTAIVTSPPPSSGLLSGEVTFQVLGKRSGPLTCTAGTAAGENFSTLVEPGNEATCDFSIVPATANPITVTVSYYGDPDGNYSGSYVTKRIKV